MNNKPLTLRTIFICQLFIGVNILGGQLFYAITRGITGWHPWSIVNLVAACAVIACALLLRTGHKVVWWTGLLINIPLLGPNNLNTLCQLVIIIALLTREIRYFFGLATTPPTARQATRFRDTSLSKKWFRGILTVAAVAIIWWGFPRLLFFLHDLPYRDMPADFRVELEIGDYFRHNQRVPTGSELQHQCSGISPEANVLDAYVRLGSNAYAFVYPGRFAEIRLLVNEDLTRRRRLQLNHSDTNVVMLTYSRMVELQNGRKSR